MIPLIPIRRQLIQNAVFIPEKNLYLKSTHVHDCVIEVLDDGREVMIDGGLEYVRRSVHPAERVIDLCLYDDSPFEAIAEGLLWGTYGKGGNQPLRYRPISTLELDHLIAIRDTQFHISARIRQVVEYWIAHKSIL